MVVENMSRQGRPDKVLALPAADRGALVAFLESL
jgi:hypothetical protein